MFCAVVKTDVYIQAVGSFWLVWRLASVQCVWWRNHGSCFVPTMHLVKEAVHLASRQMQAVSTCSVIAVLFLNPSFSVINWLKISIMLTQTCSLYLAVKAIICWFVSQSYDCMQYDLLYTWYCHPSVCLSLCLEHCAVCIMVLSVGVGGWKLYCHVPVYFFRHLCHSMYRLAATQNTIRFRCWCHLMNKF